MHEQLQLFRGQLAHIESALYNIFPGLSFWQPQQLVQMAEVQMYQQHRPTLEFRPFPRSGLQTFSVLRGFIYDACLQPCIAYCSVQGYA